MKTEQVSKMQKVLITGIDSFTGLHLAEHLQKEGYEIHGTSLFASGEKKYKCDITNKEEILKILDKVKPHFLIHLSAISFTSHGQTGDFYTVNTIGTINILDACVELDLSPKKIILASSAAVYGNQGIEVLDESLCPIPANHYGASKYAMECLARNYFDKLPLIIARPFNYTGKGQAQHFLIPKILKHYKEKKPSIELGNLDVSREFNDIEYVCEIYKRLLESTATSQVFNICSAQERKLLDVIETMNHLAGYTIEVKVNPDFVRKDEIKTLKGSTQKLFQAIGEVKQKSFEETLRGMLEA